MKTLQITLALIVILASAYFVTTSAWFDVTPQTERTITDSMRQALSTHANDFAFAHPNEFNTAHEIRLNPSAIYYNDELDWYAVAAPVPQKAGVYAVAFMDEREVFNVFTIDAATLADVDAALETVGYVR